MKQYTLIYKGAKFHVHLPAASPKCYEHICTDIQDFDGNLMIGYDDSVEDRHWIGHEICHLAGECPYEIHNQDASDLSEIINKKFPALRSLRRALSVAILGRVGFSGGYEDAMKLFSELNRLERENWRMKVTLQFYADVNNYIFDKRAMPIGAIKALEDVE